MSVKVTTLPNGLRVATDTMPDAESVMVGAWVGVGTRHEPWKANGVAHLVEHMMFKGTKTRSAYALSAAIEKNGGSMNAHTTQEETAYYARVLPEDAGLAVEIVADMLQRSAFAPKELDRERKVIIQEIGRYFDTPEDHVMDLMQAAAFPKQRIGRPILGSGHVIAELPRADVTAYVREHYHAGNMVAVAAGRIEHGDFVALAQKHFGKLPKGRRAKADKARVAHGPRYMQRDSEQLHIVFGFAGPNAHQATVYPAYLLSILLGGNSSSRLFQKVREKRGLVYTVSASHMPFSDAGLFQIYAGTDPLRAPELIPVVCRELLDVTDNITEGELKRARAQARADLLMGKESVSRRAEALGHQMIAYGKPIKPEDTLKKIMAVTREDVMAVASGLFGAKPVVTALGPLDKLESYESIVERLAR